MIRTQPRARPPATFPESPVATRPSAILPRSPAAVPFSAIRARSAILTCVAAAAAAGCAAEGSNALGDALPSWEAGSEQIRIGSLEDPEHAYGAVRSLTVDGSGRIYTSHWQELRLRVWSPDGGAAGFVGREGEGPGEFSDIRAVGIFGDSLWVTDARANRTSFFDEAGSFLGSLTPAVDIGSPDSGYPPPARPELPLRDGGFYGRSPAFSQAIAEGDLTWTPHVRMDGEGAVTDTLYRQTWRPEHQLALLAPDGQGGTFGQQPFPDGPVVTPDPEHGRLLVVERPAWTGSGPATWSATAISMRGDTLWSHEHPYEPAPLPSERLDSAAAAQADRMHEFMSRFETGLTVAALTDRIGEALYRPAWVPPVTAIVPGRDGSVWIGLAPAAGAAPGLEWLVLDAEGRPTERATTPAGLRVLEADRAHVWGVVTDELDVNYIVRHPLVDPEPPT